MGSCEARRARVCEARRAPSSVVCVRRVSPSDQDDGARGREDEVVHRRRPREAREGTRGLRREAEEAAGAKRRGTRRRLSTHADLDRRQAGSRRVDRALCVGHALYITTHALLELRLSKMEVEAELEVRLIRVQCSESWLQILVACIVVP
eukprot:6209131-Pleurochrysis_carterae.AAC.1